MKTLLYAVQQYSNSYAIPKYIFYQIQKICEDSLLNEFLLVEILHRLTLGFISQAICAKNVCFFIVSNIYNWRHTLVLFLYIFFSRFFAITRFRKKIRKCRFLRRKNGYWNSLFLSQFAGERKTEQWRMVSVPHPGNPHPLTTKKIEKHVPNIYIILQIPQLLITINFIEIFEMFTRWGLRDDCGE